MRGSLRVIALALAAAALVFAGCESDTQVTDQRAEAQERAGAAERPQPIASGSHVARCKQAMIGNQRSSLAEWRREGNEAGRFALLEIPGLLRSAHPAGTLLGPRYREVLVTKVPASVRGSAPVTVSVPAGARDEVGLLYGSLRGYRRPFARITFMPCDGYVGTAWSGGLALRARRPVTLFVTTADGDRVWRLRVD